MKIIFASKNKGKIKEITNLLNPLGIEVVTLYDLGYEPEIEETGDTFFTNALIKAKTIGDYYNMTTISDDSGLEVKELNNSPGVNSAYYAGKNATSEDNNNLLIKNVLPLEDTSARFVSVMCLYNPQTKHYFFEGDVFGNIIKEKRGTHGFGYDPIFYIKEYGKTMAELSLEEKNKISHRGKSLSKLVKFLKENINEFR